jgi:hypothetical protein
MKRFITYLARLWRIYSFGCSLLSLIALTGCQPNFMTGASMHQDPNAGYIAGYNADIDRERRGLPPPTEQHAPNWNSYWCDVVRSIDSDSSSPEKKRLKQYLIEKRRAYGLAELNCR